MDPRIDKLLTVIALGDSAKAELRDILQHRADEIFEAFVEVIKQGEWGELTSPCGYLMRDLTFEPSGSLGFSISEGTDGPDDFCHRERFYFECYTFMITLGKAGELAIRSRAHEYDCGADPGPQAVIQALSTRLEKQLIFREEQLVLNLFAPPVEIERVVRHKRTAEWVVVTPQSVTTETFENVSSPDATAP